MSEDDRRLDDCFDIYKNLIVRYAKSYVGDYYLAEDICQETFIRYGEYQGEIRESSAKYWLMKTAKNLALDYLRKNKRHSTVVDLDTVLDMLTDDRYADVSGILEEKEKKELLKRAIFRLKIEHNNWYDVLVMDYVERMDNSSIGNELGVSASLVSKWKERARAWLREAYMEEEQKKTEDDDTSSE